MADRPVYSTAGGSAGKPAKDKVDSYKQGSGPMKMRLETKGRGGKAVTVLFNLPFPNEATATAVMKELQGSLGTGATLKNSAIEVRGDLRDKITAFFSKKGIEIVKAGG